MKIAIDIEERTEEFDFENIAKGIWEEIVKIPCGEAFPNEATPKFHFHKGFEPRHRTCLGLTHMKTDLRQVPEIHMFMHEKGIFRLDAFIHECIHARGFHHNPNIGFVTEIDNDRITAKVCENLGLIGITRVKVLRKFRKSRFEKYIEARNYEVKIN